MIAARAVPHLPAAARRSGTADGRRRCATSSSSCRSWPSARRRCASSRGARAWLAPIARLDHRPHVHGARVSVAPLPHRERRELRRRVAVGAVSRATSRGSFRASSGSTSRRSWRAVVFVVAASSCRVRQRRVAHGARSSRRCSPVAARARFHYGRMPGEPHRIRRRARDPRRRRALSRPIYRSRASLYRGGWMLKAGDSMSFLARAGATSLALPAAAGATIEIDGRAYMLAGDRRDQRVRVDVDRQRAASTLRCVDGTINLDRMERDDRRRLHRPRHRRRRDAATTASPRSRAQTRRAASRHRLRQRLASAGAPPTPTCIAATRTSDSPAA